MGTWLDFPLLSLMGCDMSSTELRIFECKVSDQFSDKVRTACYLLLIAIVLLLSPFFADRGLFRAMAVGAFCGLLCHWVATRRVFIVLRHNYDLIKLPEILSKLGYKELDKNGNYRLTLPRWMYFNHQDINLCNRSNMVTVSGPRHALKSIRRRLLSL